MPKKTEITCDECKKDLTTTGNSVDYRTILDSEGIPGWGGAVTDMMKYPQFEEPRYFCNSNCFWKWAERGVDNIRKRRKENELSKDINGKEVTDQNRPL